MELESAHGVVEQTETSTSRPTAAGGDEQSMDEDLSSRATLFYDGSMLSTTNWVDDHYDANEVAMTEQDDQQEHEMEVEQGHDGDEREREALTEHAEKAQDDPDEDADYYGTGLTVHPGTPPSDAIHADIREGQPSPSSIQEAQSPDIDEEKRLPAEEAQRQVKDAEGEADGTADTEEQGPYANVQDTALPDGEHTSRQMDGSGIEDGLEEETVEATADGTDGNHAVVEQDEDTSIQPIRITFNDQDFVLFPDTEPSSYLTADGTEERIAAPTLSVNSKCYYESLDSFVEALRIREALGDFFDEGTELKLSFEGLALSVCEDDVYAREVTLDDIARICHVLGHRQSMHIIVTEKERFITRYNELATQTSSRLEHALDEGSDIGSPSNIDKTVGIAVAVNGSAEKLDSASAHAASSNAARESVQKEARTLQDDLSRKDREADGDGSELEANDGLVETYDGEEEVAQTEGGKGNAEATKQDDEAAHAADEERQSDQGKDASSSTQSSKQSKSVSDDGYEEEESTDHNEAFEPQQGSAAHRDQAASTDNESLLESREPAEDAYEDGLRLHEQESGEGGHSDADRPEEEESVADYEDAVYSHDAVDEGQAAYEDDGEVVQSNKRSLDGDEQDPTSPDFDTNETEVGESGDLKRVRYDDEGEQDQ